MDSYLSHARRGRTAWWRYPLTIAAALVLATLITALLMLLLSVLGLPPRNFAQQLAQPSNPGTFFAVLALLFASLCAGLALAAFLIQRKKPADIIGQWRWRLFFTGAALWLAVQLILAAVDFAIAPDGFSLSRSGAPWLALWALGALLIQTVTEEFIFRGFLTQAILLAVKKPLAAAGLSGLLFGAMHIPNGLPQAINATWFGMICAYLAIRTGGIALTSGIHLANNYFGAVAVVSADDVFKGSPGLVIQNTPYLTWWDLGLAVIALALLPWLAQRLRLLPDAAKA